ncbi:hypothetical protein LCGC14_0960120 [marine sediment metagenome]|uniref:Uncharacterized protein n=1 Tax=marine sediment metagenome TaxID=412755 RepID=A0A0F9RL71_9ZZZZ
MKLTSLFTNLSKENLQERLNPSVTALIDTITEFLDLDLVYDRYTFLLTCQIPPENKHCSIFDYGVERSIIDNKMEIKIFENQFELFPFILLREIYNLFIPREVRDYEWIQLTI